MKSIWAQKIDDKVWREVSKIVICQCYVWDALKRWLHTTYVQYYDLHFWNWQYSDELGTFRIGGTQKYSNHNWVRFMECSNQITKYVNDTEVNMNFLSLKLDCY